VNERVLVVSSHPAVDVEWRVARVLPEEKNAVYEERRWPGGKGINVTRWLKWLGAAPRLLLPIGGPTGKELTAALRSEMLRFSPIRISEPNRANVVVTPDEGPQLRFNPVRPRITAGECDAFRAEFRRLIPRVALVVISGALAPGLPIGFYGSLIRDAAKAGRPSILDCDGPAFRAGLAAKPILVKPNEFELAEWAGRKLGTEKAIIAAAQELSAKTGGWVLVSRGAEGASLIHARLVIVISQSASRVSIRNTVGAGDAMVAAAAQALIQKASPEVILDRALKAAAALVQQPAGQLPRAKRGI
jgi:1-phosphofructokinase family hexose kinase